MPFLRETAGANGVLSDDRVGPISATAPKPSKSVQRATHHSLKVKLIHNPAGCKQRDLGPHESRAESVSRPSRDRDEKLPGGDR